MLPGRPTPTVLGCFMMDRYTKDYSSIQRPVWLVLFISLTASAIANTAAARQPGVYQERALAAAQQDFSGFGLKDCQQTLSLDSARYLAICRLADPSAGSGPRLLMVDTQRSGPSALLFRSSDFGDAYYVKLTVFEKESHDSPDLVLAEFGAEFSYGVRVYTLDDAKLRLVGHIDAVLDQAGVASSVLPALRIIDTGREIMFSFTESVMLPKPSGDYTEAAPGRLRYVLDGHKLRRSAAH